MYVQEGARFVLFLIVLILAYTYRRNVGDEYRVSEAVHSRFNQPFGVYASFSKTKSSSATSSLTTKVGIESVKTNENFWQWMNGPCRYVSKTIMQMQESNLEVFSFLY